MELHPDSDLSEILDLDPDPNIMYLDQGCESGSTWICIHFTFGIRICIQYADPDSAGEIFQIKTVKMLGNC